MTNEMKLITALCEALGFDVERVCINQDEMDAQDKSLRESLKSVKSSWFWPANEPYVFPIYDYKLTKRDPSEIGKGTVSMAQIMQAVNDIFEGKK